MSTAMATGRLESINPANGEVVGTVTLSSTDDVDTAVERARKAQPAWAAMTHQ